MTLDRKVTLGAIALSAVYAALVMAVASPVSFYTLDDPYIHMALAENIARGHFGVNLGEVSNPSSSILWPWLLATFERIGVMLWAPLLVNIACFVLTLRIMLAFCMARLAPSGDGATNVLILVGLAALAFNLFGVIFTGMEHSLHVLLSVVAVTRAIDGKYDRVTLAAVAIAPLVRFEAAIILAFSVGAALADKRWMFAASAILAAALPLALYAWWLSGLGLPILPSSVLSKSAASSGLVDGGGGMVGSLVENLVRNAQSAAAPLFAILAVGLVYAALKRAARDRLIALGLIAVLVLVMLLGRMDSYARYEVYALCVLGVGLVHLLQSELRHLLTSRTRALILGVGLCLLGASLGPYVFATTPQGARNVDRQQHQMHRLLAECWRMPVAVNDLGWVSFRNDHYVLDLWGLGSETARKARAASEPGWMKALADANAVDLAMIYPQWFEGELPAEWVKLGEIGFTYRHVTTYAPMTTVYATRPGAEEDIRECMRRISDSAPEGVQVTILRKFAGRQRQAGSSVSHPLDKPIWTALETRHAHFREGGDLARRYPREVSPFVVGRDSSSEAVTAMAALIGDGEDISLAEVDPPVAPDGVTETRLPLYQMLWTRFSNEPSAFAIQPLSDADAPDMLALATITRPGPFRSLTHTMGRFFGVREGGDLIAMAGERLHTPGFHEITAVCTHPDHRGRGLGAALMRKVGERMLDEGDQPFLHTYANNAIAVGLYRKLGFEVRAEVTHAIWKR